MEISHSSWLSKEIGQNQRGVWERLERPGRLVYLCTGDFGDAFQPIRTSGTEVLFLDLGGCGGLAPTHPPTHLGGGCRDPL